MTSLDEETEVEMMLRIEAEERARLEEEVSNTHEAQMLQPQHSSSSRGWTERISSVGSGGTLGNLLESCSCSSGDVLSSSSAVDLSTIAKRFGILGVTALGGAPAQVQLSTCARSRAIVATSPLFGWVSVA